jgi:hypothetical protein
MSFVRLAGVWSKIYPGTSSIWGHKTDLFMNTKNDAFACSSLYKMWQKNMLTCSWFMLSLLLLSHFCTCALTILFCWLMIVVGWFDTQTCRHHKSKQRTGQKRASRCCCTCHIWKYQDAAISRGYSRWQWHARFAKVCNSSVCILDSELQLN